MQLDQEYRFFVGIDWGTQIHRIVLLDCEGRAIEQYDAAHTGDGLENLVDRLLRSTTCEPETVAIAIETSWGALVETLLDHGFAVFSINPKQVDRFRDRFTVAGAKDDTRDALVLASCLRTDRCSFRRVEIDTPEIIRLRELSRFEDELKAGAAPHNQPPLATTPSLLPTGAQAEPSSRRPVHLGSFAERSEP